MCLHCLKRKKENTDFLHSIFWDKSWGSQFPLRAKSSSVMQQKLSCLYHCSVKKRWRKQLLCLQSVCGVSFGSLSTGTSPKPLSMFRWAIWTMRRGLPQKNSRPSLVTPAWTAVSPSTATSAPRPRWPTTPPRNTCLISWGFWSWTTSAPLQPASRRPSWTCYWRYGHTSVLMSWLVLLSHSHLLVHVCRILSVCRSENPPAWTASCVCFLHRLPRSAPPELSRRSSSPTSWMASWSISWRLTCF